MDEMVIQFFNMGFYNVDDMKLFVQVQWITKEQYKETTGIDYATPLPSSDDPEPVQSEAPVEGTPASEATSEIDDAEVNSK
ncbi:MAG TPA: XkdX family protein [Weissella thailandensis]|uniref:XkdX family protein n=1 Tax=Weissella thailandensis TaxID=89061 RepID=UPI001E088E3C|nr:XkdX family protein [Weissella thailandensis]HJG84406.1 XkdX family protein [Weissella thailandensis]